MLKNSARLLFAILLVTATVSVSFMGQIRKHTNPLLTISSPLTSTDPKTRDESDLSTVDEIIGDATVIGLGEGTHGSHEFFQMKQRLIQYLIKEKGFSLFSIEAPMPQAAMLNAYLLRGEGNPRELIKGMLCWAWSTEEMLDLLKWMREYNQSAPNKVIFTGFDFQSPPKTYTANLIKLLQRAGRAKDIKLIETLSLNADKKPLSKELLQQVDRLSQELLIDQAQLHQILEPEAYEDLFQYLRLIKQYLSYHYYSSSEYEALRDQFMSENILWLQQQHPNAKIIIWAHNFHIFHPDKSQNMGKLLKEKLGDHYRAIGFVTYEGSYRALSNSASPSTATFEIQTPPPHAFEALLNQLQEPLLMINLSDKEKIPAVLQQPISQRSVIGFKETPLEAQFAETASENPELKNLSRNYEGMVFIKTTSAASSFPEILRI